MSTYFKDELMILVKDWDVDKLERYIHELENRAENLRVQISDMKKLMRRKKRTKPLDTGVRGGK